MLGEAWEVMLAEKRFFETLRGECNGTFAHIDWWEQISRKHQIECPDCGSSLIYQEDANNGDPAEIIGRCKACGEEFSAEQTVEAIIDAQFGDDAYSASKEGLDPVINICPECANSTYVESEETAKCFFCNYEIEGSCARCGTSLCASNMSVNNSSLCDYCDHVSSRDD
jgi:ssDNA-binding Zn-finger/Zn-ribbon topoisomerase 1